MPGNFETACSQKTKSLENRREKEITMKYQHVAESKTTQRLHTSQLTLSTPTIAYSSPNTSRTTKTMTTTINPNACPCPFPWNSHVYEHVIAQLPEKMGETANLLGL